MKLIVYTVHAYRWGDRENHSYTVGVYPKKHAALEAAKAESAWRGGKYECEVLEWALGEGNEAKHSRNDKAILALPPQSTLKTR